MEKGMQKQIGEITAKLLIETRVHPVEPQVQLYIMCLFGIILLLLRGISLKLYVRNGLIFTRICIMHLLLGSPSH